MPWVNAARAVCGAVAIAVLSVGIKMIPDNRRLGLLVCGIAVTFGAFVAIFWLISENRFRRIRDGLGSLLDRGEKLRARPTANDVEFASWKDDLNGWYRECQQFLKSNLSQAHVAMFVSLLLRPRYSLHGSGIFGPEHENYLHSLDGYIANLRAILERYLSVRD